MFDTLQSASSSWIWSSDLATAENCAYVPVVPSMAKGNPILNPKTYQG